MTVQRFRVLTKLSVRATPDDNAMRVRDEDGTTVFLQEGEIITVLSEATVDPSGDYIWWQHERGWSAERETKEDGAVFMVPFEATSTAEFKLPDGLPQLHTFHEPIPYRVRDTLSVRQGHNIGASRVQKDGEDLYLAPGMQINATARFEGALYIWLQHEHGWSAERERASDGQIYMTPITADTGTEETPTQPSRPGLPDVESFPEPQHYIVQTTLSVRTEPYANASRVMSNGEILMLDAGTVIKAVARSESGKHVWLKHERGWSAERERAAGGQRFLRLQASDDPTGTVDDDQHDIEKFERSQAFAVDARMVVRIAPRGSAAQLQENGEPVFLDVGNIVEATARVTGQHYLWLKHEKGWTAERSTTGSSPPYLRALSGDKPADGGEEEDKIGGVPVKELKFLRVATIVSVRQSPSIRAARIMMAGESMRLYAGEIIKIDRDSSHLRAFDKRYDWVKHEAGWSAVTDSDDGEVFIEPTTVDLARETLLPDRGRYLRIQPIFERIPIEPEQIGWLQYFGSTTFALALAEGKINGAPRTSYAYAQGFHAGFDYGNAYYWGTGTGDDTRVFAGVHGTIKEIARDARYYRPMYVRIITGEYTIIYGHMTRIEHDLKVGQSVTPDTQLGEIKYHRNAHLHLEVRYGMEHYEQLRAEGNWFKSASDVQILNPLLFMTDAVREQTLKLQKPKLIKRDGWDSPTDQPIIRWNGAWAAPWPMP